MKIIWQIAVKEFSDRFRSGWVIGCIAVWLAAVGLTSFFGSVQIGRLGFQGYDRTVLSLLNLVQYLIPLLGLLIGHDLVAGEREDGTLGLLLAGGVRRWRLLLGKFLGGWATLALPLVLGFAMAGGAIATSNHSAGLNSFVVLAASGLALGTVFIAVGLLISVSCRTRVKALVFGLLVWGMAVFAYDLVAMGVLISTRAPAAAHEIEVLCDTTHLNNAEDLHNAFDAAGPVAKSSATQKNRLGAWLVLNPIDGFRMINLSAQFKFPGSLIGGVFLFWTTFALIGSFCRLRRMDV